MLGHVAHPGRRKLSDACRCALAVGVILALTVAGMLTPTTTAWAQIAPITPRIVMAERIAATEASDVPFPIKLEHADAVPPNSWIEILTIPVAVTFSPARNEQGVWRLALADVANLRMKVPAGSAGRATLFVMLVSNRGTLSNVAAAELTIAPAARPASPPLASTEPTPPAVPSNSPANVPPKVVAAIPAPKANSGAKEVAAAPLPGTATTPPQPGASAGAASVAAKAVAAEPVPSASGNAKVASAEPAKVAAPANVAPPIPPAAETKAATTPPNAAAAQIEQLLGHGGSYLTQGNIAIARQYFLSAAGLGSADGAFRLAETHDPHELAKAQVVGLKPDLAEAKRWYERAAALGDKDAAGRLRRLAAP